MNIFEYAGVVSIEGTYIRMKIRSCMVLEKHDRTIDTPPLPYKARVFDTNSFAHTAEATSLVIELPNDTTTTPVEKKQQACTTTNLRHGRIPRMILFTSSPMEPERLCFSAVNKYEIYVYHQNFLR